MNRKYRKRHCCIFSFAMLLVALFCIAGCGSTATAKAEQWTISRYEEELSGSDPIEPFNRVMFEVNDIFLRWVFRPVGTVYGSILPRPVIVCINNATDNVAFPGRMISSLCQAEWKMGGTEVLRFVTNSTIGIGGLFDPAAYWFGLPRADEDFGQVFATWGIGSGPRVVLPALTAANVRDIVGTAFDYGLDPKTYFYGGQAFTMLNKGMTFYRDYETLVIPSADGYESTKLLRVIYRRIQVENRLEKLRDEAKKQNKMPPQKVIAKEADRTSPWMRMKDFQPHEPVTDTLRLAYFRVKEEDRGIWSYLSLWSSDFVSIAKRRSVPILPGRPELEFSWYPQPENPKAPLVFILPGLGSHHSSTTGVAMAELFSEHGMTSVVMSNPMNWAFHASAGQAPFPGYTPSDAQAMHQALRKVIDYLKTEYNLAPERIILCGFSLGGLEALFIADAESKKPTLGIRKYVAINPPVDLLYSLRMLDEYADFRATGAHAMETALQSFSRYLALLKAPVPVKGSAGFTPEQAKLLVGLSFRQTLRELIFSMHREKALPQLKTPYHWGRRAPLYVEIDQFNYMRYVREMLYPAAGRGRTLEQFSTEAGLHAIADTLRMHPDIRVVHAADDFLLTPENRQYLDRTLGEKLFWFAHGGHLGQMYREEFQRKLVDFLLQ